MKSLITVATVAAAAAIAAPAFAQSAADFSPITYNTSAGYTGISQAGNNFGAVTLRAGADFGKYVGLEGEGAFGVTDGGVSVPGASIKVHLNHEYAGYAVARYPVLPNANVFARIGYGHSELKVSGSVNGSSASATASDDSLNYGVGGQYMFDGKNGLRLEWTRYDFRTNGASDADSWTLSFVHKY